MLAGTVDATAFTATIDNRKDRKDRPAAAGIAAGTLDQHQGSVLRNLLERGLAVEQLARRTAKPQLNQVPFENLAYRTEASSRDATDCRPELCRTRIGLDLFSN